MPTTGNAPTRLSDAEVGEMLALTRQADGVELKLTVPDSERRAAVAALGLDPLEAQIRQVYFFDTPDLALDRHGVVVRARRIQGRGDDSVVKLRPVVPAEVQGAWSSEMLVVEVDAMPGGYVCSASMKRSRGRIDVKAVAAGERKIRKLYSKEQRAFFTAHAPSGVALDELSILGPIHVLKLKLSPPELRTRLVAELWLYPDGSRILELSAKSAPADAFQLAAELKGFLIDRGLDLSGEQQTKTRTALEYFSASLTATA
ncbi:MAG: hypothetical protein ABWX73_04350 [Marmoricola sp.]